MVLLLPAGLLCVAMPFAEIILRDRGGLIPDTAALFGAGTDEGVPIASSVSCVRQRAGSSSSRGIGLTSWDCVIDLAGKRAEPPPARTGDPYPGMSYEQAMAEHSRQIAAAFDSVRNTRAQGFPRLERSLPLNQNGTQPAVRRLSAESETPARYGLVWGWGELLWRWVSWLFISALFIVFGGGALFATWLVMRDKQHMQAG